MYIKLKMHDYISEWQDKVERVVFDYFIGNIFKKYFRFIYIS